MAEPIMVHCDVCLKMHAALSGDTPCATGAWREDATGTVWEAAEKARGVVQPQRVDPGGTLRISERAEVVE